MSRIQRLGIGNGGVDCQITYMQGKKYPNATEIVKPVQGVTNKNLLKNPYNTLNEPIAKPGQRPLRITTDNLGNVFARSESMLIPGVTNNNLLKNPNNILETPVPEKRTLTLQRIKDINNKNLPGYVTENKGINEIMLQIVSMIIDKPVKLITIHLLKILVTNNAKEHGYQTQQNILKALNAFDQVMTISRKIFKENTLSPLNIPDQLRPYIDQYENNIKNIYGNMSGKFINIDNDIQLGLSELSLLSNGLSRMFEYNNSIDPSNTLSMAQIQNAAFSSPMAPPPQHVEEADAAPPVSAAQQQDKQDEAKDVDENKSEIDIETSTLLQGYNYRPPPSLPVPVPALVPDQGYSPFGLNRLNPLLRPAILLQSQAARAVDASAGIVAGMLAPPPPVPGQPPPAFAPFSLQPLNPVLQPVILLQAQAAEAARRVATKIKGSSIQEQRKQINIAAQQINRLRQQAQIQQAAALDLPVQSPGIGPAPSSAELAAQAQNVANIKADEAAKLERIRQRNIAAAAPPSAPRGEEDELIELYGPVKTNGAKNLIRFRQSDIAILTKSQITQFLIDNNIPRPPTKTSIKYRLIYTLLAAPAKTGLTMNEILDKLIFDAMYEEASKDYSL